MKKNKFLVLSLCAGWLGMMTSCNNDSVLTADAVDLEQANALSAKLVFNIATPSAGNIVMRTQTEDESAIKSLNIYLFELSSSVTDTSAATDADYVLLSSTSFTSDSEENAFTSDGTGGVECSIDIEDDWADKTIRALIVANDAVNDLTEGTSTISNLKEALATAEVSDGDHADVLVGNPSDDDATGFPMTAEASLSDGTDITLGSDNVELSAELVRSVARVDLFCYCDVLTVDYVYISGVANQSYLFAQSETAEPSTSNYISLYPLKKYCDEDDTSIYTSWSYDNSYESSLSNDADDETKQEAAWDTNAHEGEFYLYEQTTSSTNCPTVHITFSTSDGYGTVEVPFKSSTDYVSVERNHRYIIQLGGDTTTSGGEETTSATSITATLFELSDWEDDDDSNVIEVYVSQSTSSSSDTSSDSSEDTSEDSTDSSSDSSSNSSSSESE